MAHFLRSCLTAAALGWMAAAAHAQSAGPSLVVDVATGAVLHEDNASMAWHPASTTKMMTAYVALRAVRAGRIGLETAIPASPLAARQPRVKVYIKPGQEITLDNAMKIMMVKSANDISYVIAEGVGGTVENFVEMMNAEARRLGMRDTVFANPNGWHHPQQQTSARDLAVLALALLREFPEYGHYWGIGAVQLGRTTLQNTNGLMGRYAGANGFKTGFVCASGFNVVAMASRGGRTLIAVVLGAYSGAERTVKAAQLLDNGFSSWGGGRNVASIPASGTAARSICAEVRQFGRGAPLADDVDTAGPIGFAPNALADNSSVYAVFGGGVAASQASSSLSRAGGRISLGPRGPLQTIQVGYGRTAGSASAPLAANVRGRPPATQVAGTQPAAPPPSSAALAAPAVAAGAIGGGAVQRAARNAARPDAAAGRGAAEAVPPAAGAIAGATAFAPAGQRAPASEGPIRLQGAIGSGQPAALRPSAAAGIRQPSRPAPQTASAPAGRPAGEPASARAKPSAQPKPGAKPTAQSAAQRARADAAKPRPKPAVTPPRRPAAGD